MSVKSIDWPGLLQAGLRELRLTPEQFWRLTPLELRIMLGAEAAFAPLSRTRLAELLAAFPDHSPRKAKERRDGAD